MVTLRDAIMEAYEYEEESIVNESALKPSDRLKRSEKMKGMKSSDKIKGSDKIMGLKNESLRNFENDEYGDEYYDFCDELNATLSEAIKRVAEDWLDRDVPADDLRLSKEDIQDAFEDFVEYEFPYIVRDMFFESLSSKNKKSTRRLKESFSEFERIKEPFTKALQNSRAGSDIKSLEFEEGNGSEEVVITFNNGGTQRVNVYADSEIAMMYDIIKAIM